MALGFGFGFGRLGGRRSSLANVTLTLIWTGVESDTTPDFDLDLPTGYGDARDAAAGDTLRLEYSANAGSSWNAYLTHVLTSGEVGGDPITVSGVSQLGTGDYLFRARLERGAISTPWSASEDVTVSADSLPHFTIMFN